VKKIGLIGGVGPESTPDYYKLIIGAFRERRADSGYPEIIIYSANLAELMELVNGQRWDDLTNWLLEKVDALHRAGADFAAIGSNTPHIVFQEVSSRAPLPMVSITDAVCRKAQALGLKKLGLLGTRLTMESDFYLKPFIAGRMEVSVPEKEERELIHQRLFSEIELGIIKDSTRRELLAVVRSMIDRYGIDAVILGCTELPLILDQDAFGIPFLNTTAIHAEAIVNCCLGNEA